MVSGGAFGCDIHAHLGVLDAEVTPCPGIVVMAGGLSELYPRRNEQVFRKILSQGGTIVSERFWWAKPHPKDFPVRNRLIAGLSECVWVVQAANRSGALITAKLALEEGREVVVLKQPEDDIKSEGNRRLRSEGAIEVCNIDLDLVYRAVSNNPDL